MTQRKTAPRKTARPRKTLAAVPSRPAPTKRLRLMQITVQLHTVWDDGSSLSPGPATNPIEVTADEIAAWGGRVDKDVEEFGAQWLEANTVPEGKG